MSEPQIGRFWVFRSVEGPVCVPGGRPLNLTKQQVQDLPPADIHHPNGESGARGTAVLTGPVAGQTGLRGLI